MDFRRGPLRDFWKKKQTKVGVSITHEGASSHQSDDEATSSADGLHRKLLSPQIFMIAISGIIGVTILATMGQFIHTAGPAGLLTAIFFVGATAICVMEGLGELTVQWPVSNAMMQYVKTFVDEELAIAVGLVYWYTWSSVISSMVVAAADLSQYWDFSTTGCVIVFYVLCPVGFIFVNWIGVFWYGVVECIGGFLKLLIVLGGGFFLVVEGSLRYGSQCINQGYQADRNVINGRFAAVLYIIPLLTYGFLGVEIVSVTGFEAKHPRTSLKTSARWIAYTIFALFLLCGVGEMLNVSHSDPRFSSIQKRIDDQLCQRPAGNFNNRSDFSILVTVANDAGFPHLAGFFNGCLIFGCLSAANTALYVASRVLYGLVNDHASPKWLQWLAKLNRYRVPMWSLVISAASWFWLPFVKLNRGYSTESFFAVIITIGSVGTVIVWASQCLAFIRYYHWLRSHKKEIRTFRQQDPIRWKKYDRWLRTNSDRYYSILSELQPVPAYIGLLFCCLIVFVFSTATMWTGDVTAKKIFVAYGGVILCIAIWLIAKIINRNPRPWKRLEHDVHMLKQVITEFETRLYLRDEDDNLHLRRTPTSQILEEDHTQRLPMVSVDNNRPPMHLREHDVISQAGTHLTAGLDANPHRHHSFTEDEPSPVGRWGH